MRLATFRMRVVMLSGLLTSVAAHARVELERPIALGGSFGVTCVNAAVPGTCLVTLRAAVELKYAELHLGAQPADYGDDNGPITSLTRFRRGVAPPGKRYGMQVGLDVGTPYFVVRRVRDLVVSVAGRASLDFDLLWTAPYSSDPPNMFTYYVFSNTFGPNLGLRWGPRFSLNARLALGYSLVGTPSDVPNSGGPCATFTVDAFVGVLARF